MLTRAPGYVCPKSMALVLCLSCVTELFAEPVLSQRVAVERALREHPRLLALRESIAAFEAAELQAGLRPNPELSFEIEELRFSDAPELRSVASDSGGSIAGRSIESVDNGGFRGTELTLSVSQRIELGRKRAKRIALADQTTQVALWDYEIARGDVIAATRSAFIEVLAGQERVTLRRQLAEVAKAAADVVRERVEGGKVSPLQGNQADIAYAQARIELTSAERELASARALLAAQWGVSTPEFDAVEGDLEIVRSLPRPETLEVVLRDNPELSRWSAEVARREEAVKVERSKGVPDLTVSAGWRNAGLPDSSVTNFDSGGTFSGSSRSAYDDSRENSLLLQFSIPLPLFDRNQGRAREAEHRVREASYERRAYEAFALGRLAGLHERLSGLVYELGVLENEVLPAANKTYEGTREGFELGKFPFLNVLDAQRTLFEARNQHMKSLAAYHLGVVELERWLGSSLGDFTAVQPAETPAQ